MSQKIRGITIEIGGDTSKLVKSFSEITQQSKDIQKGLTDVNKLLKFDPKNVELLSQKSELLSKKIDNSKVALEELNKIQSQMDASGVDKASLEYMALQREIEDTKISLSYLEKESEKANKALNEVKAGGNWDKIKTKIEGVQKSLTDVGKKMQSVGKSMSMKVTAPIVAAGTASFMFAADLEDAMGASDQIFKNSSKEVKDWADKLDSYYGVAEKDAITYANTMGAMLQNIGGLSEKEAAKQSQMLIELAADLTAMFGGTTEEAVYALTGALKGNNTMLDNYGMGVNEATIKTKAMEMGLLAQGEQMDLATKQAATLALIMEQTADAQGQASRESESASGSMRSMVTELKNLGTEIGEVLLPIITPFIQKISEGVQWFGSLDSSTKSMIVTIGLLVAAIGPVLTVLGTMATLAGALNVAMLPMTLTIGGIILAIGLLVAAGVWLTKNWDEIKAKASEIWEGITTAISDAISGSIQWIKDKWDGAKEWIGGLWDGIKTKAGDVWEGVKKAVTDPIDKAKTFVGDTIDKIKGFFKFDWSLPKLKLPHVSITGSFSLFPLKVPKFGISWYADGGIFNRPTILPTLNGMTGVGEYRTGGEVVAPLSKLKDMINSAVSNHQPTIVNHNYFSVNGKQIATEVAPETDIQFNRMQILKGR